MVRNTFLFDLDNTLVDSSPIEDLRRANDWRRVFQNLHRVRAYPDVDGIVPHSLPSRLKSQGYKVGIVTSSPREYAKQIIESFGIASDTLVCYHDTTDHKPLPAPLLLALENLASEPEQAYAVGDSGTDTEAAIRAGVLSIGVTWGVNAWKPFCGTAPDLVFHKPQFLLKPASFGKRGYFGELVLAGKDILWHRGSLLWLGPNRTVGFCLGRYFSGDDPRQVDSDLSELIHVFKSADDDSELIAEWMATALRRAQVLDDYSYIVCVPPRPSEKHNRFGALLRYIERETDGSVRAYRNGIKCIRDYDSLKTLDATGRRSAVAGAFQSTVSWEGAGVILLDDVLTTGATTDECTRMLQADGAGRVLLVGLARDQFTIVHKECPKCGRIMRLRRRHSDGEPFWGCTGFSDRENQCRHCEDA